MLKRLTVVLSVLVCPLLALAQPLSDRVPANALIYVGWQGTDSMPASFQQTRLKAVLENSGLPQLASDFVPSLIEKLNQQGQRGEAEDLKVLASIGGPLLRNPSAFYFCGLDMSAGFPMPQSALICKAGKDAEALHQMLSTLAAQAQGSPIPIRVLRQDDLVGLTIGYDQAAQALAGGAFNPITANDGFKQAMAQAHKEPVAIIYQDVEAMLTQVDMIVRMAPDPQAQVMWPKVADALGVRGLKRMVYTGGFEGQDWTSQIFIAAPSPRQGLLSLLEAKPVSDALLKAVPATATSVFTGHFDIAKLFTEIRTAAGKVDPQAQQGFDQVMAFAQMALTVNLQNDLFASLGDEWAIYSDPGAMGSGVLGVTLVNRLANPANAQRALGKLEWAMDNMINSQLQREKIRIGFEQTKVGDLTIHYVALPVASPAWAIKGDMLYVGLYPQVVATAAEPKAKSILDNADFVAMRKRLGGEKASGLSFNDLPKTAADGYQGMLLLSQAGLGLADMFGVKTPPLVIPPLSKLRPHLAPAGGCSWTDDAGWHFKSLSPFPGSQLMASEGGLVVAGAGMAAAVALPAVSAGRERANRVKSASNLRQIGQGVMLYANDHKRYPLDLGVLHVETDLPLDVFTSPASNTRIPPNIRAANAEQRIAWIDNNADYVYLGSTLKPADGADLILAYEKSDIHGGQGMNVLFNDGHVEWMMVPTAMAAIQRQQPKAKPAR